MAPCSGLAPYHPYLQAAEGSAVSGGRGVDVRIAVINDKEASGVIQDLGRYALGQRSGELHRVGASQWNVTMRVAARDLPAIAPRIPSVLWVQPNLPIVARDEAQGLVLAGDLSPCPRR